MFYSKTKFKSIITFFIKSLVKYPPGQLLYTGASIVHSHL